MSTALRARRGGVKSPLPPFAVLRSMTFRLFPRAVFAACASALFCLAACATARAVIFDATGSATFNTTAPTGALANSGWQYQGLWNDFLGTAIAPHFFITAGHVTGNLGDAFTFGGVNYVTTAMFDDPDSDLRIWQVAGTLPTYAPLYTGSNELGKSLVVFGRGTQRGAAVTLAGFPHGWLWGAADGVQRWGENQVAGIVDAGAGRGSMLVATFDHGAGTNEATLSVGDSGGGVFIKDGGVWKLAGINYGVDGPYSTSNKGTGAFNAALYNQNGFYEADDTGGWVAGSGPGAFYATRISSNQAWIATVIPEPSAPALALSGAAAAALAFSLRKMRRRRARGIGTK